MKRLTFYCFSSFSASSNWAFSDAPSHCFHSPPFPPCSLKIEEHKEASVKGGIGPFGLLVLASDNLDEYTAVFFRVFKNQNKNIVLMCSDQSRSSLRPEVDKTTYGAFVDVELQDGKIDLKSMIDHSIVESFGVGGRTCISTRVYPNEAIEDKAHLHVFNYGAANVNVSKLSAWEMKKPRMN